MGGHFAILLTGVDNVLLDGLKIDTNRDGIDIDCCRNVRVSNCAVNSPWDDAICPKSSFALGYARATEYVTITNCYVTGAYEYGSMLNVTYKRVTYSEVRNSTGRIKCGAESNGSFRNITISGCILDQCRGFALETVDGARIDDITVTNLTLLGVVHSPFFLRLGRRMRETGRSSSRNLAAHSYLQHQQLRCGRRVSLDHPRNSRLVCRGRED
jgi:polygalacturonase